MNIIIFLLSIVFVDFNTDKASFMYQELCSPSSEGNFVYAVDPNFRNTGVAISALFWSDVDKEMYWPGERCAVKWTLFMFGPEMSERINEAIQNLKWTVGEIVLFHRGLFFCLKRNTEMAPEKVPGTLVCTVSGRFGETNSCVCTSSAMVSNLSFNDFQILYVPKLVMFNVDTTHFFVCDYRGVDTLVIEFLKDRAPKVTVLHIGKKPRYFPVTY